jgi:membrane protease YdiL (CAAX protease family)
MPGNQRMGRAQAAWDIVAAVALVAASAVLMADLVMALTGELQLALLLLLQGLVVLIGLRLLLIRRGQTWSDVGLAALRLRDIPRALLALASCVAANVVLTSWMFLEEPAGLQEHLDVLRQVAQRLGADRSIAALGAMMLFVGVYEELAARGFLLARFRVALPGTALPVVGSALLFGLGHVYQGWIGVAQTTLLGVILAAYTLRWGTLWPAILAHAVLNTVSVFVVQHIAQ